MEHGGPVLLRSAGPYLNGLQNVIECSSCIVFDNKDALEGAHLSLFSRIEVLNFWVSPKPFDPLTPSGSVIWYQTFLKEDERLKNCSSAVHRNSFLRVNTRSHCVHDNPWK